MTKRYQGLAKEMPPMRVTIGADLTCPATSTTVVITLPVPANSVAVGDTFEFIGHSINTSTPTVSLSLGVGAANPATTIVWTTPAVQIGNTVSGMAYRGLLTVKSIGAAGTVMGGGMLDGNGATANTMQSISNTNATQVVDTTAPWFITMRLILSVVGTTVVKSGVLRKVA